jgi:uncharacterized protein HemY
MQVKVIHIPGTSDSIVLDVQGLDTAYVGAMTELGRRIEERMRRVSAGPDHDKGVVGMVSGGRQLMASGHFEEAGDLFEEAVRSAPESPQAWQGLLQARVFDGDGEGVVETLEGWMEADAPGAPTVAHVTQVRSAVEREGMHGYWTWLRDDHEARLAEGRNVSLAQLAAAHAALGNTDRATDLLVQALKEGDRGLMSLLQSNPVWDPLRKDPRFVAIVRQVRAARFASPAGRSPRY